MNKDETVYLVVKVKRSEMAKIRRLIHKQEWYTGDDVPIADRSHDIAGIPVKGVFEALDTYFITWKAAAAAWRARKR